MPVPIAFEEFKKRNLAHKANQANIKVNRSFCWWCGEHWTVLTWKYWHGFCTDKCIKEYRDLRLGRNLKSRDKEESEDDSSCETKEIIPRLSHSPLKTTESSKNDTSKQ